MICRGKEMRADKIVLCFASFVIFFNARSFDIIAMREDHPNKIITFFKIKKRKKQMICRGKEMRADKIVLWGNAGDQPRDNPHTHMAFFCKYTPFFSTEMAFFCKYMSLYFANTRPPFANTHPSFAKTRPSFVSTQPSFANTGPSFSNTRSSFANTRPSIFQTHALLLQIKILLLQIHALLL